MFLKWAGYLTLLVAVAVGTLPYTNKFLDWLKFRSLGTRDYIAEKLAIMFVEISPERVLLIQVLLIAVPSVLVMGLFLMNGQPIPGVVFTLVVGFGAWAAPKPIVEWLYRKRVEKFVLQMIDGLAMMSGGLKSGLSVVQACGLVAKEMSNPIRQEFELLINQNKLGVSLEEAFQNLSKRVQADDVEMFVTSVNILKETGGNLAETFDTIVSTIRERIKVEKKIQALTAQGVAQGFTVAAVPPVLGLIFYFSDPGFMTPLFTSTIGWMIVLGVLLLEVVGIFVIMKIVKIDV